MINGDVNSASDFGNNNSGILGDRNYVVSTYYLFMLELNNAYGEIGEAELGQYYHKQHH